MEGRDEGSYGTTDPVLWVYSTPGYDYSTVQKTREQLNNLSPHWSETICLDFVPGDDDLPCFEIHDDYDPAFPPDRPPMLHQGCATARSMRSWGVVTVSLSKGARVFFNMAPRMPAPPPMPPTIPSPAPPPPNGNVAQRLNERFRRGSVQNDVTTAGVLVHQFDAMDDPNPDHSPWLPGVSHSETGDRISAALINAWMQADPGFNIPIYSFSLAGVILNPAHNRLLCSYPWDVGSLSRHCWPRGLSDKCIPGCSRHNGDTDLWCAPGTDRWKVDVPACAWRPEQLGEMMKVREEVRRDKLKPPQKMWNDNKYYAELIFDAAYYVDHLPDSIEAVFFLDDNCGDAYDGPKCKNYGIGARDAIAKHFGLDHKRLPLLKLDLWNWQEPFSEYHKPTTPAA